jgi:cell division protein ZapA
MATVSVEVNGRAYTIGCEDGQEAHVEALARQFDAQVQEVSAAVGQVGELRLFLMAALMTADELADARQRLGEAESHLGDVAGARRLAEGRAADALEAAAARIEALAARAG